MSDFELKQAGCPLAEEVYSNLPYHIAQWCILTSCSSSIVVVIYSSIRYLRRWSETITKEIVFVLYVYVLIYDAGQIANQSVMLYYRYSAPTPCDMQIPRSYCIARLLGSSVVPSFVVLNIAITVQRAMATFGASRRRQMAASRALIGVSALYAIGYGVYTYVPEPMDGYATYCSAITMFSGVRVILNIYVMFALDIFNVMGSSVQIQQAPAREQHLCRPNYHLGRKYNHLVNVSVLSKSLIMQIIHTIVYFFLFVAYVIVGIVLKNSNSAKDYFVVNALMNVFPYYALVCPSVLTFLVRKEDLNKKTRVQELITMASQSTTEYFKGLAKHWETAERASARA